MGRVKIFDLHLDLQVYLEYPAFLNMKRKSLNFLDLERHGDIPQFLKAGLKFAVVNIFPFSYVKDTWQPVKFNEVESKILKFLRWIKKYPVFEMIYNASDLAKINNTPQKIGIILGVEGLNFLSSPKEVFRLYEQGIRVFGLNWNIDSKFSSSLKTATRRGLTKEGKILISYLQKLNAVLDLAHSSTYTVFDVFSYYKKPVIFSHNGVKKIVHFEQNVDDDVLKLLYKNKGLIGLTLLPYTLEKDGKWHVQNWFLGFSYLRSNKFKNNIAVGTDFFGFKYNKEHKGFVNYIDFYKSVKILKVPNYVLFYNAFQFFKKAL